jgi:hypothetical protein
MNEETKSGTERFIYGYHAYDSPESVSRITTDLPASRRSCWPWQNPSSYRRPHAELQSVQFAGRAASSYSHFASHTSQARIHRHYSFSRKNPAPKPLEVRVEERFQHIQQVEPQATITQLMMARARIQAEEQGRIPRPMRMKRRWRFRGV